MFSLEFIVSSKLTVVLYTGAPDAFFTFPVRTAFVFNAALLVLSIVILPSV